MSNELSIWESKSSLAEIEEVYCKDLNPIERKCFRAIGVLTNLNPFMREIFAVKYSKDAPAQIFIGRDGYRKVAQRQPQYDGHFRDAIKEGDTFEMHDGNPRHVYGKNRGKVIGAYFLGYRKDISRPYYIHVDFQEYTTGKSIWLTKPSTMIQKVAEAQGLRMMFDLFSGTYDESERWDQEKPMKVLTPQSDKPFVVRGKDYIPTISESGAFDNILALKKEHEPDVKLSSVDNIQDCQEIFLTDMDSFTLSKSFEELKTHFAHSYRKTFDIKNEVIAEQMRGILKQVYDKIKATFLDNNPEKQSAA